MSQFVADRVLVLMRHAKSSWSTDDPDHARPLSTRGQRDGAAAGAWLREHGLRPDLAIVSTSVRTRETLSRLVDAGAELDLVDLRDEVYVADSADLIELVRQTPAEVHTLMLLGHNPAMEETVFHFARRVGNHAWWAAMDEKFPTSAIAVIGFDGDWSDAACGVGALLSYEVPRG